MNERFENEYLLLTPGPLTTSRTVRAAMDRDWCTWDDDYNQGVVTPIRDQIVRLATATRPEEYTSVLMQGSGTFSVESMIGSVIPSDGKLLVLANGAYGDRIAHIARRLKINHVVHDSGELSPPDLEKLKHELDADPTISHVVAVHVETTTGMINPIQQITRVVKDQGKTMLVDSMSAFGGVPMDVAELGIDYLVSSANKCIQGVPGFGFVIARKHLLGKTEGWARSLSLDLYAQWRQMEDGHGKWRYTSPTHVVRAFHQALEELRIEGGVQARGARYAENQRTLVEGMERLGFRCLLPREYQSPIITSFYNPDGDSYYFRDFYEMLKQRGFCIYPGKVTNHDTFRIGTIGQVWPDDVRRLLSAIEDCM